MIAKEITNLIITITVVSLTIVNTVTVSSVSVTVRFVVDDVLNYWYHFFEDDRSDWYRSRMNGLTVFLHHGIESVVIVSSVVNHPEGTIGFSYGVMSFDHVSVSDFFLGFVIASMRVTYSISKFVFWIRLKFFYNN